MTLSNYNISYCKCVVSLLTLLLIISSSIINVLLLSHLTMDIFGLKHFVESVEISWMHDPNNKGSANSRASEHYSASHRVRVLQENSNHQVEQQEIHYKNEDEYSKKDVLFHKEDEINGLLDAHEHSYPHKPIFSDAISTIDNHPRYLKANIGKVSKPHKKNKKKSKTLEPTTSYPTIEPTTSFPTTLFPTGHPSDAPTLQPSTSYPTSQNTLYIPSEPSQSPLPMPTTMFPTKEPTTLYPTIAPTTGEPATSYPSVTPTTSRPSTSYPTNLPTPPTTAFPSSSPSTGTPTTAYPTSSPSSPTTHYPTSPTIIPTFNPSVNPTPKPTTLPTTPQPSITPTRKPSIRPSSHPSKRPTQSPLRLTPSNSPILNPSQNPVTPLPTHVPFTAGPSHTPTRVPTLKPTISSPSKRPTATPIASPIIGTKSPTHVLIKNPTHAPTKKPTFSPTKKPVIPSTAFPTVFAPTFKPTLPQPSASPTINPTNNPTFLPSSSPTLSPSMSPTINACPNGFFYQGGSISCKELGLSPFFSTGKRVCSTIATPGKKTCLRNGKASTYAEAKESCNAQGMRLCSLNETLVILRDNVKISECVSNSGSSASGEKFYYWTSTPCNSVFGFRMNLPITGPNIANQARCEDETLYTIKNKGDLNVICCSDSDIRDSVYDRPCSQCLPGYTSNSTYQLPAIGEESCYSPDGNVITTKAPTPPDSSEDGNTPNILFLIIDDLVPQSMGGYKESLVNGITPNMDSLMKKGITFTKAYVQQASCGPSRASILTSMRPDWSGVTDFLTGLRDRHGKKLVTFPQHLKEAGYKSVLAIGKIFDGRNTGGGSAQDYPFSWTKKPVIKNQAVKIPTDPNIIGDCGYGDAKNLQNPMIQCITYQPTPDASNLYDDYKYATEAVKVLDTRRKLLRKPWFLAIGFSRPHLPWASPKLYWQQFIRDSFRNMVNADMQDPIGPTYGYAYDRNSELGSFGGFPSTVEKGLLNPSYSVRTAVYHGYYSSTTFVDAQLGRVLNTFYARDKAEVQNTIIVLLSDNGFGLGGKSMFGKHNVYESATRVPLVIVPQYNTDGVTNVDLFAGSRGLMAGAPVEMIDIFPTLLELTRTGNPLSNPMIDGISLVPILKNPLYHPGLKAAAVSQHQSYVQTGVISYSLRTWRYRYVVHMNGNAVTGTILAKEFYDYSTDPREAIDRFKDPNYKSQIQYFEELFQKERSLRWPGLRDSAPFDTALTKAPTPSSTPKPFTEMPTISNDTFYYEY